MDSEVEVAVVGAGAWGRVFSSLMLQAGAEVSVWARRRESLSGLAGMHVSTDLNEVVCGKSVVVVALPSAAVREVCSRLPLASGASVVSLSKGLEAETNLFMGDVLAQTLHISPSQVVVVSGPNLSAEIAEGQPSGAVAACLDLQRAQEVSPLFSTHSFRPYLSTDVIGAEVGGVVKNVIAVAVGAAAGMGYQTNTRAMLITRGLAEMARLGKALGAQEATFLGLAGVGDLIATCSSPKSRNFTFGFNMGSGMKREEAFSVSAGVVEGARSARAVLELAGQKGVEMPITAAVAKVVFQGGTVEEMGEYLMGRARKMDGVDIKFV
ncbi:MAG: NAD(P)H-dependent glycerol-3-phosphate dehydrogenase [Winkia neuii]|uniref:NAD(P)H-dependent glycerol-3-phosphate dehydrogenase n=1 Tax=Winkia neuii TaxID=33007 RepID=UPI000462B354|nr:NAD(P)H-dependent glycerol-3-phosphate dehydrogenase [Winkia neuii]MDK8099645.1 NAD(P)H-dependent glycerol-3-phosphate dehydrogenase [Winkia neuii]MDU3135757.1 NAD(P)H-dependent glycerol-3-phosphate dehydrogenase [Winkia neuii]